MDEKELNATVIGITSLFLLFSISPAYADSQLTYVQINGQALSTSDPTITVSQGASLNGVIKDDLKDPCSSCAIYSVGINSWDRSYYSDLGGFSGDNQWHNKQFSFSFIAPSSSGTYYIAIGYGLCYAAADVVYGCYGLSDSRRGQPGGGDDIWDIANWESMMPANQPSGAWRAIKIIVQQPIQPTDSAIVASFNPPTGTKSPGDSTSSSVAVRNTGTSTRSYWVGLSYQKPDGTWYDVSPQQTNTLSPNSQQTLTFYWNLPSNAPSGSYNARTAVWNGYNPSTNLMTEPKYDQKDVSNAFTCYIPIITPTPTVNAQISSFTISNGRANHGDVISFEFDIKNTGNSKEWVWPFVMIVGPYIDKSALTVGKVTGTPVQPNPGQTRRINVRWTVPSDAPAGDYVAVGYVFDQDPAIASSKSLSSEGSWFMIGGASFLQVEGSRNHRLIHVHVEQQDIPKLKSMAGGAKLLREGEGWIDVITLNQLFVILKSSGLSAGITDDDIAGVFLSYDITIPNTGSLDVSIIQQSGRLGRIYEGTYAEAQQSAGKEFREGLMEAIPVGGDMIDILNTAREMGPIAGLIKVSIFISDTIFDTYAGLVLTAVDSFKQEINLDQTLTTADVPTYYPLQIPNPISIEEISPAGQTYLPGGTVNIIIRVSDSTGKPIIGASAYWIQTTGENEYGRMTEKPGGVYSAQLKAPYLPGTSLIMVSLAKPEAGVKFQDVQVPVSAISQNQSIIDIISNFFKNIFGIALLAYGVD